MVTTPTKAGQIVRFFYFCSIIKLISFNVLKKVLSTVLLTMTVISCNDNEREVTTFETEVNNLNKPEILQGFINAKDQMKGLSLKTINSSTNKVVLDEQSIKRKYEENFALINKETGLKLKYDEGEFKAMLSSLEADYINKIL